MVSMVVLMLLMGILLTVTTQTGRLWRDTTSKIASFQDARAAFDALTRNLTQATLNHYYDYYDSGWNRRDPGSTSFVPANYGRASDLHFVAGPVDTLFSSTGNKQSHAVFFEAPLGRVSDKATYSKSDSLINALGYYVEFSDNTGTSLRPKFLRSSAGMSQKRFRLMEWMQPSEKFRLYDSTLVAADPKGWYSTLTTNQDQCRVMADNILALVIQPQSDEGDTALAPSYSYDSRPAVHDQLRSHLLPPRIRVTLVAIDRDSARRLQARYGDAMPPLWSSNWFKSAAAYETDMKNLEDTLQGKTGGDKVNYRIFTTTISTRDSQ